MTHAMRYRSGFEFRIAEDLDRRGIVYGYETYTIEYRSPVLNGICTKCECKRVQQRRKYKPDFIVPRDGQPPLILEAKGILDGPTRSKMKDIKRANPTLDIRFLFDGKPTWARGKIMVAWCIKNGFRYHFGHEVPEEWLRQ